MAQLKRVVDPFGEVNVNPGRPGQTAVRATVLMEPHREGAQTGIALDGSGSMSALYGGGGGGISVSAIFRANRPSTPNELSPVAQRICAYLARKIDADQGTTCIYWATGPAGSQIEEIGDLTAAQAESHLFGPPKNFGTGTQLLPAVRYFVERFADAPWGFYVFLTDGELHDLDEVKAYTRQLARDIAAGRRKPLKLVLVGLGDSVNERQMSELDDLDTGTNIDLWDHKLARELRVLEQIFAEVVDRNARIAPTGRVRLPNGEVVREFPTGVPAMLEFDVPTGTPYFTLELPQGQIHQGLSETATVPETTFGKAAIQTVSTTTAPAPATEPATEPDDGIRLEMDPAAPPAATPPPAAPAAKPIKEGKRNLDVADQLAKGSKKESGEDLGDMSGLDFDLDTDDKSGNDFDFGEPKK
ncbi:vWA domain-containing protein [Tuwongella immobilis]|uniref:VWFA domain-containing protein n=1 Tax=Tuwongella immobilis TaxID=692036 RepID=A0A6C2YMJ5_9BACT|nr:VWA domain-containing protein [Tuwongella immobilis]VIP02541.1 Uncharacterized protein OS=Thioploca ingrica GN=THII_1124 PE=4 SV=1 [Tuwongella immobilis]VTS01712.1 Uncharacterized protein OS=Thioploca ingrica GN=THII_1124 PE=4 SV=1 [Tuwongella immobilis]